MGQKRSSHARRMRTQTPETKMLPSFFFPQTKMSQHFKCQDEAEGVCFCRTPAFHRLLFMPPFAGDIGARAGSLKRIAQIPRKAYRWALRGDLKNIFGPKCGRSRGQRTLSCVPTKHKQLEGPPRIVRPKNRATKRSSSGVVCNFVVGCSNISLLEGRLLTRYCASHFCQLRFAHERSAKVRLCKTAPARNGSIFL